MDATVLIAKFSDSFEDVWHELIGDLEAGVEVVPVSEIGAFAPTLAAIVLAAGGAESRALEWLEHHTLPADVPVLMVGADAGRRMAAQAVRRGAADYLALPEDVELLRNALAAAVHRQRARDRTVVEPRTNGGSAFSAIVGESPALKTTLLRAASVLRHANGTALIMGETGTGKELLARAIHSGGPRHRAPFVPVNCSALPANLIESELFGHERGAFTDAHAAKPGLFEVANGGTLFLDEVGTLPTELQAKLLRVLEDQEIRRVGGTKSRRVDVRIIAATNENLDEAVRRGAFRRDLYYRLSVFTLRLPPLRARGKDVLLIADRLLAGLARQYGVVCPPLSGEAKQALLGHSWPGNVRELRNGLERALLLSPVGTLDLNELIPPDAVAAAPSAGPLPFPAHLDTIATAAARATLDLCAGNVSEAARRLQISRRRLRRLIQAPRRTAR